MMNQENRGKTILVCVFAFILCMSSTVDAKCSLSGFSTKKSKNKEAKKWCVGKVKKLGGSAPECNFQTKKDKKLLKKLCPKASSKSIKKFGKVDIEGCCALVPSTNGCDTLCEEIMACCCATTLAGKCVEETTTTTELPESVGGTSEEPSDGSGTSEPSDDSTPSEPSDDSSTSEPSDDSSTSKPSDDSGTSEPSDDMSTSGPSDDGSTSPPSDDGSTSPPSDDSTTVGP